MSRLTVDSETLAKLHGLAEPVDLCDEQGRVLGHFVPYAGGISPADFEPSISAEELNRRAERFRGGPLADLIGKWEQRK